MGAKRKKIKKTTKGGSPTSKIKQAQAGHAERFVPRPNEILPFEGAGAVALLDANLKAMPQLREALKRVRAQKDAGARPLPSQRLHYAGALVAEDEAKELLDQVARLVDENLFGRSEMCMQFAELLARLLQAKGFPATAYAGSASYRHSDGKGWFTWKHAWVVLNDEIIDGNVDTMCENPMVPAGVNPTGFWGPSAAVPGDRKYIRSGILQTRDDDVERWWQRLAPKPTTMPSP